MLNEERLQHIVKTLDMILTDEEWIELIKIIRQHNNEKHTQTQRK